MQSKTVQELRALAQSMGIEGYSRMRKDELLSALKKAERSAQRKKATQSKATPSKGKQAEPVKTKGAAARKKPAAEEEIPPAEHIERRDEHFASEEEQVEDAKFMTAPPGMQAPATAFTGDLGEDLDALPPVHGPKLTLLAQKPGVLHAYWSLEPGRTARQPGLLLRLSYVTEQTAAIIEEAPLPSDYGHWYFHVDPAMPGTEVYLQLGHYAEDGEFITAIRHGAVRLPRLGASSYTDRNWWVSDEDFRRMYLRSGGLLRGDKLTWPGGVSSPGGAITSRFL